MYKGYKKLTLTAHERRALLRAVAAIERKFGAAAARWGMRKHLAIVQAKQKVSHKVRALRAEIRQLEASAK